MKSNRVFDILVYRLSPEARLKEVEKLKDDSINPETVYKGLKKQFFWDSLGEEQQKFTKEKWERTFYNSKEARGWLYNDVVGYITIFANLNQIKAEYWFIEGRILRDMKNRIFCYRDKVFEFWVLHTHSSKHIYKRIEKELLKLELREPFRGRYIDMETFQNIGPVVDWKVLTSDYY